MTPLSDENECSNYFLYQDAIPISVHGESQSPPLELQVTLNLNLNFINHSTQTGHDIAEDLFATP